MFEGNLNFEGSNIIHFIIELLVFFLLKYSLYWVCHIKRIMFSKLNINGWYARSFLVNNQDKNLAILKIQY